jgi:hypothetical protein
MATLRGLSNLALPVLRKYYIRAVGRVVDGQGTGPAQSGLLARRARQLRVLAVLWFVALPTIAGFSVEVLVFGPETYVRGTGEPVTVTKTFPIENSSGTFTLRVHNHGVTSAVIAVNRRRVLSPEDFKTTGRSERESTDNKTEKGKAEKGDDRGDKEKDRENDDFVPFLERPVHLRAGTNEIAVELRSKPGTWLSVEIVGAYVPTVSDLDPEELTMAVGDTASLTVSIQNPDSLRAMHVTLASGNTTVVSVPAEVVLAAGAGACVGHC